MPSPNGDQWQYKKQLGSGSFGEVLLYQLGVGDTSEYIALKKCKSILQHENLKRWRDEVEFMRNLEHPNIVQGRPVPPELEAKPNEPPCLAMEFCSKGDLRKKLSELPNMCGLPEGEILLLAKHIASAMEYLHKSDIIHRDIKPENIMVQDWKGQNMYKLTDLGFAKDSKNQPATSFVGTKEYMAPELYSETQYTKTADYWSFGTVLSEIITGNRPFMLSVLPVVKWHEIIAKKNIRDIGYYEDCDGNLSYAKNVLEPHQLCRPMRESLEKLLVLLLCRCPRTRGGDLRDGRPIFYHGLETILVCKVIHVRCMMDGVMASFPTRSNDAVVDLHKTLISVTGLPADQHLLLLAHGERLTDGTTILHSLFRNHNGDRIVYLYPKTFPVKTNFYIPPKTPMVEALMTGKHLQVSENGFKVMWKQSIHYCHNLIKEALARQAGFVAYLNYNLKRKANLNQCAEEMKRCLHRLQAKAEFFLESMTTDTQQYARQIVTGFSAKVFYDKLKEMEKTIEEVTQEPEQDVKDIERKVEETMRFIYETQKDAERLKTVVGLQETSKKCDASFRKFKDENKVKRRENMDLTPIQNEINEAHKQFCEYNQGIFKQIGEVQKSCLMIDDVMASIQDCVRKMEERERQVSQLQREKQQYIWEILKMTIAKKKESDARRSRSLVGHTTIPFAMSDGPEALVFDGQSDSMQESMSILNESIQIHFELDTMMRSISEEHKQHTEVLSSLDWGHLRADDT